MLDFQRDVIDRSKEVPVVVDFWASWCGPCRVLGPVIEQLAEEADGEWELVKVSTESHPDLSRTYDIMSIPAVKMFYQGEIVADFAGALPRPQIQKWLAEHLPSEEKARFAELQSRLAEGSENAQAEIEAFLKSFPEHQEAKLLLVQQIIFQDPARAERLLADLPVVANQLDSREDLKTLIRLMKWEGGKEKVAQKLQAAQIALQNDDQEAAIKLLVEAVMIDKKYEDDLPRKACIAFFRTLWGHGHHLTKKHRISFDMALY
ncbi:MAG: tetratricopeptide repeat protein [Bacteroidota bacterium]